MAEKLPPIQQLQQNLLNGAFVIAAAGGAYFLVSKFVKDAKRDNAMDDYGGNGKEALATNFATVLFSSMFSGYEWVSDWIGDGTDEELIMKTAADMYRTGVSFSLVAQKYKALYDRDLLGDLQKELQSDELQDFNRMLTSGLSGLGAVTANQLMATVIPTTIYDERLMPINQVTANTILGKYESQNLTAYGLPDGRVLVGFLYNQTQRYVDSKALKLVA